MSQTRIILNFHGIGVPYDGVDSSERRYWISEEFFSQILDLVDRSANANSVIFTFDDGNRSDLAIAAQQLKNRGRVGSFFVLTGRLESPHSLSASDLRTLTEMGMEVGLHGRNHVDWRTIDQAALNEEIPVARKTIEEIIGKRVESVGVPFGAYNRAVIQYLKSQGFATIYTSDGGPARAGSRIQNRTSIRDDMGIDDVARILSNQYSFKQRLRRMVSTTMKRYFA
jgi:peptidoglycan/xylan/chitin deacetylase (PgdA/CDA1 family)